MIAQLFPDTVHTVTAAADTEPPALLPAEEPCIGRAVTKRRREFAAGRACAREALAHFGIHDFPLLVGLDRAPVWPRDIVGSITHCTGFVGVAAARAAVIRGIGVDAEDARPLDPDLVETICLPRERQWMGTVPPPQHTDWPKLLFSAKEAVYKCIAPGCERFLAFHDVEITFQPAAGRFAVRFPGAHRFPQLQHARVEGRFATSAAHVFTGVLLTTKSVTQSHQTFQACDAVARRGSPEPKLQSDNPL